MLEEAPVCARARINYGEEKSRPLPLSLFEHHTCHEITHWPLQRNSKQPNGAQELRGSTLSSLALPAWWRVSPRVKETGSEGDKLMVRTRVARPADCGRGPRAERKSGGVLLWYGC